MSLCKLHHRHHHLAQLLADGSKGVEASRLTGYSEARISVLRKDPLFAELLASYEEQAQRLLTYQAFSVAEELFRRLDENPESFSNRELISILGSTLDRIRGQHASDIKKISYY